MITIKLDNFQDTVGKIYGCLVGETELTRGIHLKASGVIESTMEKFSDRVVITFTNNKPKLKVNIWPVSVEFTEIEKVVIYEKYATVKLNRFPDMKIVGA